MYYLIEQRLRAVKYYRIYRDISKHHRERVTGITYEEQHRHDSTPARKMVTHSYQKRERKWKGNTAPRQSGAAEIKRESQRGVRKKENQRGHGPFFSTDTSANTLQRIPSVRIHAHAWMCLIPDSPAGTLNSLPFPLRHSYTQQVSSTVQHRALPQMKKRLPSHPLRFQALTIKKKKIEKR